MNDQPTRWPRAQMLDAVERSPACVAAQDKAGWLALFSDDAAVEDPVGTSPNRRGAAISKRTGDDDLGRFYDTFIADNEIRFEVFGDFAAGDEIVRDVVIHTKLNTGLAIDVPAFLIYQLADGPSGLHIRSLRAVWDLRRRSISAIGAGLRGLYTLVAVSARMFRIQGVRGMIGYTRGLLVGIFGRGAAAIERLTSAIAQQDAAAIDALFLSDATIEIPAGSPKTPRHLLESLGKGATLRASSITSAGWLTFFRFEIKGTNALDTRAGVALLEFDPRSRRVARARFFARDAAS